MRTSFFGITLAVAACGGSVEPADDRGGSGDAGSGGSGGGDARIATACDGQLTNEPRVLAVGLATGELHRAGDLLVLVEAESGRVLRIDRCTGDVTSFAELGSADSAAVHGDDVYVVTADEAPRLTRVPLDGSASTAVATLPARARVVSSGGSVIVGVDVPGMGEAGPANLGVALHELDGAVLVPWRTVEATLGGSVHMLGAGPAGVYVRHSMHCSCNPGVTLVPFDGSPDFEVPGTHGAPTVALHGESLFTASAAESIGMGSSVLEIVRMPLSGGVREVLQPEESSVTADVREIAASETAVCWAGYGGESKVRCVGLAVGSPLQTFGGGAERDGSDPIATTSDAVYWLRRSAAGTGHELMAAALE